MFELVSSGANAQTPMTFRGTVDTRVYSNDILDAYMYSYVGAIGNDFLRQNDNARSLRARIIKDQTTNQHQTIPRIGLPPGSSDLTPIEHV